MGLPGTAGKGVIGSLLFELKFWVRYCLPTMMWSMTWAAATAASW